MKDFTLHMCNCDVIDDMDIYFKLVNKNDAVVFYSNQMKSEQYNNLVNNSQMFCEHIYFLIDNNIDSLSTIDYDILIDLVNNFKRTFTWK